MSLEEEPNHSNGRSQNGQSAKRSRSVRCNGELIRHYRQQLDWTQTDLAVRAGLGRRVISKAEAGEAVDYGTLEDIATALAEGGATVTVTDLLCDPATLTRRLLANYVKYEAEWVDRSRDIISPDIVAYIDGDPTTNPIAGTYRGIEAFADVWRTFFAIFIRDGGTIDNPEMIVNGNDVVAYGFERIRIPEVPPQAAALVMLKLRYEDGMLVRLEDYYETSGMMRALQRWVHEYPDGNWTKLLNVDAIKAMY